MDAFKAGELDRDFVAVVRFQGPRANGMPELHKLTPHARRAAGPRPPGGAGHRRAHVGRLRQGAGGDPRHAGGAGGRPDRAHPRRRHDPPRRRAGTLEALVDPAEWAAREPAHGRPLRQRIRHRARTLRLVPRSAPRRPRRGAGVIRIRRRPHEPQRDARPDPRLGAGHPGPRHRGCRRRRAARPRARRRRAAASSRSRCAPAPRSMRSSAIAGEVEGAIVGAGTVLSKGQLDRRGARRRAASSSRPASTTTSSRRRRIRRRAVPARRGHRHRR